ncbi:uncharacterized protein LOC115622823 [Scaptodrosophila lebanonensis]|uniref:Uncharacterized protein LOC115622823 n=1 Tax=Drosophila lebanonensis TaxID=7225 RepID=A0A6J2TCA7_DROLE|nr:uncharacterized protein LOC115622823 [Scaptodrosophila lebanonensis]
MSSHWRAVPQTEVSRILGTENIGYTQEELLNFLSKSSIQTECQFAFKSFDTFKVANSFIDVVRKLRSYDTNLKVLRDYFVVSMMMLSINRDDSLAHHKCISLANAVCNVQPELIPENAQYIAQYMIRKLILGSGKRLMANISYIEFGLPTFSLASKSGADIADALSILILTNLTNEKIKYGEGIKQIFKAMQLILWTELLQKNDLEEMFIIIRLFVLMLQNKERRNKGWTKETQIEIIQYFRHLRLQIHLTVNTDYGKTLERYIAFAVEAGAENCKSNFLTDVKIKSTPRVEFNFLQSTESST